MAEIVEEDLLALGSRVQLSLDFLHEAQQMLRKTSGKQAGLGEECSGGEIRDLNGDGKPDRLDWSLPLCERNGLILQGKISVEMIREREEFLKLIGEECEWLPVHPAYALRLTGNLEVEEESGQSRSRLVWQMARTGGEGKQSAGAVVGEMQAEEHFFDNGAEGVWRSSLCFSMPPIPSGGEIVLDLLEPESQDLRGRVLLRPLPGQGFWEFETQNLNFEILTSGILDLTAGLVDYSLPD